MWMKTDRIPDIAQDGNQKQLSNQIAVFWAKNKEI